MDEKDIQSAFAHLLEAVADRVADQAARRARGELSEGEFVNAVLRTVQSIAPDADLPLKPGEFIAPEPPPAPDATPDDDPGPDAVFAPLLDEEEEDDGSGILGWILERTARGQDGQGEGDEGDEEDSGDDGQDQTQDEGQDGGEAFAPAAAMDEAPQSPDHNFYAPQSEQSDAVEQSVDSWEPSTTPYEDRSDIPEVAATAIEDDGLPEAEAPAAAMDEASNAETGDGSLWDLEDAYTGGPAPAPGTEPVSEPGEPAPSAFALEDEPQWDVPAEAPDREPRPPAMEEGDGTAPAAMAAAPSEGASYSEATPYDAEPPLDEQPDALPWEGPVFEPEPDLTEPAPAFAALDSPEAAQSAQAAPIDTEDAEPYGPGAEPDGLYDAPYGSDALPVDDDMPMLDLDMAEAGIEVEPPGEAEPFYGADATDEVESPYTAEPPYTAELPYADEPQADGTPWGGPDTDDEPIFQGAPSDADFASPEQVTAQGEENESYSPESGWEIQDVPDLSDEDALAAPSVTMAQDDALDADMEWSADEQPLDEAAQAEMPDDEPPPLLLEDVVDAHLPPKPSDGPGDDRTLDAEPLTDGEETAAQPLGSVFGPLDGPAPGPQAAPDAPRHAADPFAFEDATQGIDGILTKAARRAPAPSAEPLPEAETLGPDMPETDLTDLEEPGMDMLDTQGPDLETPDAFAPADQAPESAQDFGAPEQSFGAPEADGLEEALWEADTPDGPPPVDPAAATPAMEEGTDVDEPTPWAAPQEEAYDPAQEIEPGLSADFAVTTLDDMDAPSPGDEDGEEPEGPLLVDQEWEPDEDDPFADLPAPPDEGEVWHPTPEAYAAPESEAQPMPQEEPARDTTSATDEDDDPFAGLPLPPNSPLAGQPSRAGAGAGKAPAPTPTPEDISSHADAATAAAAAAVAPPPPEPAPRREGPRIYTPKPRGAAPSTSADAAAAPKNARAAAPSAHRTRVIVSGSAQWENDDSHELEDTMFRLGVDEDLAHDILATTNDMAQRDRDFITKETRRALKEGGTLKNPSTAFLISLLLPGFGSVYAGSPLGIVFALPALALGIFFGLGQVKLEHALTGAVVLSVVSAFTAYINASEHNRRIRIREAQQPLRQEKRETTLRIK